MAPIVGDWRTEEATTQTVVRELNEWTEEERDIRSPPGRALDSFLCECGAAGCADLIQLTRAEYETVRSFATRFAVRLDHENPEVDYIVDENDRFATVQKLSGRPERIAQASDPRR
jgi:hypothetical protein